jgi:lysophospholipase L1-like esterase
VARPPGIANHTLADLTPPRQSLLSNLALSAAVTLLLLAGAEAVARWLEPVPEPVADYLWDWEEKWEGDFYTIRSDSVGWPPWVEFNGDGLRDRSHAEEKPEGVERLICLGDSVTLGDGIRAEQAYPQVLQELLDARGPGVEVFNVALWGWSTRQQRIAYRRIARRYSPDRVLLGVCLNDIPELQNNLSRPPAWLAWLHLRSALVRRVVDAPGREIRSVEELFETPRSRGVEDGFAHFFAELGALRDEVEDDGAELALLVFPFRFQLEAGAPPPLVQERIAGFCAEAGLRCVDLLPGLQRTGPEVFHDYDHLSVQGARRVAEIVLQSGLAPEPLPVVELLDGARESDDVIAALSSAEPDVRRAAAWALASRGAAAERTLEALVAALGDESAPVRAEVARALGALGEDGRDAMPALFAHLEDPRQQVRWAVARALFPSR